MKVKIDLNHPTGNFWIDNGIVVLYDLMGEGEFEIQEVLDKLIGKLVVETGNEEVYFNPKSLKKDTYKKKTWVFPTDKFIKSNPQVPKIHIKKVGEILIGEIDSKYYHEPDIKIFFEKLRELEAISIKKKKRKIEIHFQRLNLLPEDLLFLIESGMNKKDSLKILLSAPPNRNLNLDLRGTGVCDICGNEGELTDAKMWMFPFTVKQDRFANFYSGLKLPTRFCPKCALAGLAGYLGWLWKSHGKDKLHVFIFYSDLRTMQKLMEIFKTLKYRSNQKGGNVPLEFYGGYIHETTMGLLLRLFGELHTQESELKTNEKALLEEILGESVEERPLTLFVFSGIPGKAFNMDSMVEFSELKTLYRLYKKWISLFGQSWNKPHDVVVGVFKQFYKKEGNSLNSIWRDKISWAILELRDPSTFIEEFLYDAKAKSDRPGPLYFGTLEIFELYWKEVIKMDEKLLNVLRGFGHSLGYAASEKNEMGLLYALRNAKNADDFFKVLNDVQFRLELTVPEDIVKVERGEKISGSPWLRVKTLLSIYSMNAYLRGQSKNKTEEVTS